MKPLKAFASALGIMLLGASAQSASAACQLNSPGGQIKHVVLMTFDNVHLRRDNPNVPSDLEQMPNLLNFLQNNGTLNGNHHTPLISHTATDFLTIETGVYGDRMGVPVANAYGFFNPDGSVGFASSFAYWTAIAPDGKSLMLNEKGKTAPAPWVPFTRAGCDVGAYSVANIVFERLPDDVTTFFGLGSDTDKAVRGELASNDAATRQRPSTDFLGVAIHCAKGSPLCAGGNDDPLPDEPGGYNGFKGLFGNINVAPVLCATVANPKACDAHSATGNVKDLSGNVITDRFGHPGFPNLFNPTATQSLGYAATLLEAGVPIVYVEMADVHDNRSAFGTFGPGEAGYVAQLKQYDDAFGQFFSRIKDDGITKDNTLFIVVPDENDHFVGGPPSPANCDGVTIPCTYAKKGEITAFIDRLLLTQRGNTTAFDVHSDDAPTFYIHGNPGPTASLTRTMEHDLDALTAVSPITGNNDKLSLRLADQAEMNLLHMVTRSPARTPTFTMFGDDDYFFQTVNKPPVTACANQSDCVFENSGFAWNHGDFQDQITRTWMGIVGPGVRALGRNDAVFTDHTDIRPTMIALLGLKDDYVHDGRVVAEWIHADALPESIRESREDFTELATVFKQLNAPLGEVGRASLIWSNRSVTGNDQIYARYLKQIADITEDRNELASQIKTVLNNAAFHDRPVGDGTEGLVHRARAIIDQVKDKAGVEQD